MFVKCSFSLQSYSHSTWKSMISLSKGNNLNLINIEFHYMIHSEYEYGTIFYKIVKYNNYHFFLKLYSIFCSILRGVWLNPLSKWGKQAQKMFCILPSSLHLFLLSFFTFFLFSLYTTYSKLSHTIGKPWSQM